MTKLLVSVRSVAEALQAAAGGAHFIDLKEPGQGALGGLPPATVRAVVEALHAAGHRLPISATIGDVPMQALPEILARVAAIADCGVDLVKVGIEREPAAGRVLAALAAAGPPLVPVFIADRGLDAATVAQAAALRFPALMVDTADKRRGSLFDTLPEAPIAAFIAAARRAGKRAGIAGALRLADVPRIARLAPDFAGFRSAVCAVDRAGDLDPRRLAALVDAFGDPALVDAARDPALAEAFGAAGHLPPQRS